MMRALTQRTTRPPWCKRLLIAGGALLAATLAAEPPVERSWPLATAIEVIADSDQEGAVRTAYQKYADYVRGSGHEIRLELHGFRSLRPEELDQVYWASLFTLPAGRVLETEITQLGEEAVHLKPFWTDLNSDQELLKMTREVANLKASSAVGRLREHDPELFGRLAGVTTYEVILELAGESRAYVASFLWIADGPNDIWPEVVDHIIPTLSQILAERLPPITHRELDARLTRPQGSTAGGFRRKATCVDGPAQTQDVEPPLDTGVLRDRHGSGGHWNEFQARRTCDTDAECRSTCTPSFVWRQCVETGSTLPVGWVHKKAQRLFIESDEEIGGPSSCAIGVGCAVKSCLLGFCGGISFTGSAKVGIQATGSVLADMSLQVGLACPAATEAEDPPGGSGGGPGGEPPGWEDEVCMYPEDWDGGFCPVDCFVCRFPWDPPL